MLSRKGSNGKEHEDGISWIICDDWSDKVEESQKLQEVLNGTENLFYLFQEFEVFKKLLAS